LQLSSKVLQSFSNLKLFCDEEQPSFDLKRFIDYLDTLLENFKVRFSDLNTLCDEFSLFVSPFSTDPFNAKPCENLAIELIDLQSNSILKKEE